MGCETDGSETTDEKGDEIMTRKLVQMTQEDVNYIVQRKIEALFTVANSAGIYGGPYQRAQEDLMYWQAVQAGRESRPNKWYTKEEGQN